MANPQAEEGHIDIANEIAEALMKINLSSYESRVLWFLFRKTYGWKKKTDRIALSQFTKEIGLDRRLIHRAIKGLSSKKMIVIYKDDIFNIRYGFQKDYDKWLLSSKKMTVINIDDALSSKEMTRLSSKEIHTKETIQKKLTKESETVILPEKINKETWDAYLEMRKSIKKPATIHAQKLIIKELEKMKHDPNLILEQSIKNSWQGIFELRGEIQSSW